MKDCSGCGKRKEFSMFYVNKASGDGYTSKCSDCLKVYQKERRDNLNASKPDGWKKKAIDKSAYNRAWAAANPGAMTAYKRAYWERNKDRLAIKYKVKYAIKTGKLIKQPCFVCGEIEVDAHHPDYNAPLDVVWLCKKHHREVHK
jgi:hypothetical protein